MSSVLKIKKLTKHYGKITAVDQLDLSINTGQVYGILGPNGSGKTTTLGMILDVVAPSSGGFEWFGGMNNVEARQQIGAILETPCFYSYLTATQNLRIIAHIKKCSTDRIDPILRQVNLFDRKDDKFKNFSLGMKQRLSLAAALLSDPPVLILDEPTNGLDPEGIAEVRELITEIAAKGKTIIMASHLLDEVQKVCTDFCILRKGKKLYEGKVRDILGDTNGVEVSAANLEELNTALQNFQNQESIQRLENSFMVSLKEGTEATDLNKYCFEQKITLKRLIPQAKSLEQEFLKILKEND